MAEEVERPLRVEFLTSWMVALTLAVPMPPAKVLAQVELEHEDGLPPDWEDGRGWSGDRQRVGRARPGPDRRS